MNRQLPGDASHATVCAYFWIGIAVGSAHYQSAKEWAFSVIEALDAPPIEVATASDRNSAMEALSAVKGGADMPLAGRWVLADLHRQLSAGEISAAAAIDLAMRVVRVAGLPREVYWDIDGLDDQHQLSDRGVFGNPEAVKLCVLSTLAEHSDEA